MREHWINPNEPQPSIPRGPWRGMHVMGKAHNQAFKLAFATYWEAAAEAEKLNSLPDQIDPLSTYPCLWPDDGKWGSVPLHWHNGRKHRTRPEEDNE